MIGLKQWQETKELASVQPNFSYGETTYLKCRHKPIVTGNDPEVLQRRKEISSQPLASSNKEGWKYSIKPPLCLHSGNMQLVATRSEISAGQ